MKNVIVCLFFVLSITSINAFGDEEETQYNGELKVWSNNTLDRIAFIAEGTVWGAGSDGYHATTSYNYMDITNSSALLADFCSDINVNPNVIGYGLYKIKM